MQIYRININGLISIDVKANSVYKKKLITDIQEIVNKSKEITTLPSKIQDYINRQHWAKPVEIEEVFIIKE